MVTATTTRQVPELIDAIEVRPTPQDLRDKQAVEEFLDRLENMVYTISEGSNGNR
jgi:hypothetical protein